MIEVKNMPRITFGLIVLNGEPFISYNLRSLYPYAHQIIVVEGACLAAAVVATSDGHSIDSTLESIRKFQAEEDPENKILLVTAEDNGHPNGFWPGEKHEQSQAYANKATGDWLWQVDVDEFYRDEDMSIVFNMLRIDPTITAVSFPQVTFWGGLKYYCDSWYLARGAGMYHRLFRWGENYRYVTHRPPTVLDRDGRDLRTIKWVSGNNMLRSGVSLFHYSLLLPIQVRQKGYYYLAAPHAKRNGWTKWMKNSYFSLEKPYRVHNIYEYPSWLKCFQGEHPKQMQRMMADIQAGILKVELRPTADVKTLLSGWRYRVGRAFLIAADRPMRFFGWFYRQFGRMTRIPKRFQRLFRERKR